MESNTPMKTFKTQREYEIYVELAEAIRDNMSSEAGTRLGEKLVEYFKNFRDIQEGIQEIENVIMVSQEEE